ncbi:MAG: DUF362 domain-containing protein [Planctomycetia bacterium]|nr:DUF362 domain-containing protein [Planctomycetia bacterium]
MAKSDVFFTDFHTTTGTSLLQKLERLVCRAGFEKIEFKNKYAALKIHFGERGNLAYLRPNYAKVFVDLVQRNGGKAFLTDCNTLYVGGRKNALDHLETAYENGFNPFATGCHILIADGLKGTDEQLISIQGEYIKEAKIGRAIADADVLITLTHFKLHECAGIGGVLKNIGMGCGSRAGKMEMHSSGKPQVDRSQCVHCGSCLKNCAHQAISMDGGKAKIDPQKCVGCGRCIGVCPVDAICPAFDEAFNVLNKKIAEYSLAAVKDKTHFHVSFVMDVSPFCDCHGENDVPIVPNVGILASFDPVALDLACADLVNKQPIVQNSLLEKVPLNKDYFYSVHPSTDWRVLIDHAVKIGLGNDEYDLIKIS